MPALLSIYVTVHHNGYNDYNTPLLTGTIENSTTVHHSLLRTTDDTRTVPNLCYQHYNIPFTTTYQLTYRILAVDIFRGHIFQLNSLTPLATALECPGPGPAGRSIMVPSSTDFQTPDFHKTPHEQRATEGHNKAIVFNLLQLVI